jgi:hypothetical protein
MNRYPKLLVNESRKNYFFILAPVERSDTDARNVVHRVMLTIDRELLEGFKSKVYHVRDIKSNGSDSSPKNNS